MDVIQAACRATDWASFFLSQASPAHLKPLFSVYDAARTHLLPLIDHVSKNPDVASVALLLIVLLVSLKILNMLYRAVMFWITLALRLVFWGGIALVGLYVWSRGLEGAAQDLQTWAAHWGEVWQSEYEKYQEQVDAARAWQQQQAQYQQEMKAGWR